MQTQSEFFLTNQVDGKLTDEQTMRMLELQEGETGAKTPESGVPDATAAASQAPIVQEPVTKDDPEPVIPAKTEPEPVILAKDGVHTIPFEKLTEARAAEQHWRDVAAAQTAELEALKQAPPAAAVAALQEGATEEDGDVFGDYSETAIKAGIEKLVAKRMAAVESTLASRLAEVVEPLQQKHVETSMDAHFNAISKAHPDVESIAPSAEMAKWIDAQPSFTRAGYRQVIEQGTAQEVIELLDAFKVATGKLTIANPTAAAQAAIAQAQQRTPTSLSEIPAGSTSPHDEIGAMEEMSPAGIMAKFEGKTPEQIMALMSRAL